MKAAETVLLLLDDVKSRGTDKWAARCPAHDDSTPSLSLRQVDGSVLVHCWAGCSVEAIVAALGITVADLFDDNTRPTPTAKKSRRVLGGFREWREQAAIRAGADLRERDLIMLAASESLENGTIEESQFWEIASGVFRNYNQVEYDFDVLRTGTDAEALEIYRRG